MAKKKGTFGNRSIATRHKVSHKTSATSKWKPKGPFRFLDLPPELRNHVLKLVILDWDSHKDVLHLFLTCQGLYTEAASMFYYEVFLDNTQLRGTADPFLTGSLTNVSPRQHVRNLAIRFCLRDQMHLFSDSYGRALHAMAVQGNLHHLRLEIGSSFPSEGFWGGVGDVFCEEVRLTGWKRKDEEVWGPMFVTRSPFQNFLRFLNESNIPKITLFVDAEDHHKFWCSFHRAHSSGGECEGEWKGKARFLKIDRRKLVKTLRGAQVAKPSG